MRVPGIRIFFIFTMEPSGFEALRHFPTTSWAIWSENGDCSVEFFRKRIDQLHGRAAIVGLNRSEPWLEGLIDHMRNFHAPGHQGDRRLKRHIQDAGLKNIQGCLMTDVSDEIKTNSGEVVVDPLSATELLGDKLAMTGDSPVRFVICLGDKSFHIVREGLAVSKASITSKSATQTLAFTGKFRNETWRVFRVWHSGNYGKFIHKSEVELAGQLHFINLQMQKLE
jgi:hypothetical protein